MSQLLYLLTFLAFVSLTIAISLMRGEAWTRRAVLLLAAFIVTVHLALAAVRRDAWPFSTRGVFFQKVDAPILITFAFVGVDRGGREWEIDPESWSPIQDRTLQHWYVMRFDRLTEQEQHRAMEFLLSKAETARARASSGRSIGHRRILGPLAAPQWYTTPSPGTTSDTPFVKLRVYRLARFRAGGSAAATKTLIREFGR